MWHWLISFFNSKALLRNQAWLNGIIDSLFIAIAFSFTKLGGYSELTALYAVAIYLLTPMWFSSIAIGPRIAGFTPRLSSEVTTNLFFLICLIPIGLSELQILILGGVLAAFVLTSSKFGIQALLFLTPLVSLFGRSFVPIEALLTGLYFAIIVSQGRFFIQIKSQLMHLTWYSRENLKGATHISHRNSFHGFFDRSGLPLKTFFVKLIYRIVSENSYTSVLVKLPVIVFGFFAILQSTLTETESYSYALAAPILAASIVYLIVNLRPFLFLGEAERYLNHVAFFIALFSAHFALDNGLEWVVWALFIYGLVYWCVEIIALSKLIPIESKKQETEDEFIIKDLDLCQSPP